MLHVILVDPGEHDRVHPARLFTEAAANALEQVDAVAARAAGAIRGNFRIDRDAHRRTHGLAQLAGDAALLAVWVATLGVQATEPRRLRGLLLGIVQRVL